MEEIKILYDISMIIRPDMPVYKGREEKHPRFELLSDHDSGDIQESSISFNLHTGTHLDAPLHMLAGGDSIEYFTLADMISDCRVIDLPEVEDGITADDLKDQQILPGEVILLKTRNSREKRVENFIYLAASGAEYLVNKGIKGVGIDTLGIERSQAGHPTHKNLLANKIFIVEGLVLKDVLPGEYKLMLLPLKMEGVEAAPSRALLLEK